MQINLYYISTKHYTWRSINQWMFWFSRYNYIKGFKMRIFGVYINVREDNATQKLLKIAHERAK